MISFNFCVLVAYVVFSSEIFGADSETNLIVRNNGPAVLGSNVTFFATLSGHSESQFIYTFADDEQKDEFISSSFNVSHSMAFLTDLYNEGSYCMKVTVELNFIIYKKKVAENYTCFELKRYLIGEILIYQGNRSMSEDVEEVAVGENFTAVIDLYDPNNYLKEAIIEYSWSFDMDNYLTLNNSITYNFLDVGQKRIIAKPTATFSNSDSKSGFFSKIVMAKIPVNNVNITGNPFLHHGDFLMLNISCNGTPPFEYCSEILKDNVTLDNFTCSPISVFTTCHMEIKKFLTDGKYQMGIYIGNDVREVKKIIEIMVYNVSIKPTLSTVIIPIICSLLTLVIIAIGISYYIQQRNQLAVEVADFDFQDESDLYTGERTFFEKIFDSFACRNCGRNQLSCVSRRSESDPLLTDESLPYV